MAFEDDSLTEILKSKSFQVECPKSVSKLENSIQRKRQVNYLWKEKPKIKSTFMERTDAELKILFFIIFFFLKLIKRLVVYLSRMSEFDFENLVFLLVIHGVCGPASLSTGGNAQNF